MCVRWRRPYVQQYELATFEVGGVVGGRGSALLGGVACAVCSAVSEESARKGRVAVTSSLADGVARAVLRRWWWRREEERG